MNALPAHPPVESPGDQLRRELSALIETIEEMQTKSGPLLTARYQATLGRLELQLLELQIESQSVRRRIESLQSRINRGMPVTATCLAEIDHQIETELADWRRQLEAREQVLVDAREFLAGVSFADVDETKRVKAAYRQLARWLHPDASPENSDLFEKYWPAVQDAYQRIDVALIEALLHLVEHAVNERSDKLPPTDSAIELERLRRLVITHAERLARLQAEPPHCHAALLTDDVWMAARQNELEVTIAAESELLARLVIRLAELMSHLGLAQPIAPGGLA
ncbi:MAG: hypothetical protein Q8O25_17125 [Sulfurisoma sp.]|nr:hypothetical protein [Sulfurisoma sp.]